jgi:hypothetical protein
MRNVPRQGSPQHSIGASDGLPRQETQIYLVEICYGDGY